MSLRTVCFEVSDLQATVDGLAADGYGLVGGTGPAREHLAHGLRPRAQGIVVSLAERIG